MKVQRAIFASVGIVLLCAGVSSAQQVKTDYDRNADFGQYKTYSWEKVQTQDQPVGRPHQRSRERNPDSKGLDAGGIGR